VRTALRVLLARIRRRAIELEGPTGRFHLFPDGTILPVIAGAGPTPEEEAEAAQAAAELERAEAEAEAARIKKAEEDGIDPSNLPDFKGPYDQEKAERAIAHLKERSNERMAKAQERIDKAEARARELEQAQETEHETAKREATEAKLEAERERSNTQRLQINIALRDAAAELEVPAKKVKRLLKLVDRDGISVDGEDVEGATEAIEAVLEEFPEFKGKPSGEGGDGNEPPAQEPAGGNPSRTKKPPKELTAEQARKLAKDDPEKFHELLAGGKLEGALAGK
jgi:hypothetical protein